MIWSPETDFIVIAEGSGNNLTLEDEENGYCDYIVVDDVRYNGYCLEDKNELDAQIMLQEYYLDKFHSAKEVIAYLIDTGYIPDVHYQIIHQKG